MLSKSGCRSAAIKVWVSVVPFARGRICSFPSSQKLSPTNKVSREENEQVEDHKVLYSNKTRKHQKALRDFTMHISS